MQGSNAKLRTVLVGIAILLLGGCKSQEPRPTEEKAPITTPKVTPAASEPLSTPTALPAAPAPRLPDALPGMRQDFTDTAQGALQAAIGDVDGSGQADVVLVDAQRLRVVTASGQPIAEAPVPGAIQVLHLVDLDGDGRLEIVAGWGRSHAHQNATTRITVHRLRGKKLEEEVVSAPSTTRQDVAAIVPTKKSSLAVGYFESTYVVRLASARKQKTQWQLEDLATLRMATSLAYGDVDGDGEADLVVGRVYGEAQGGDGDAFVLRSSGQRIPIPTTRGVRGLAIADVDGDGKNEVYLGDGWHMDYGKQARGLLSRARWVDGAFQTELIENTPGQYTLWDILPADVDGDGRPEIVTRGSQYVRVYRLHQGQWQGLTIAGASRAIAVGALDGNPGAEILVISNRSTVVSLRGADWPQ